MGPDFERLLQETAEALNSARDRASGPFGPDPLIKSQLHGIRKAFDGKDLRAAANSLSAHLQRADRNAPQSAELPPDLAQVASLWADLPEAIRVGIQAMVSAAAKEPPECSDAG